MNRSTLVLAPVCALSALVFTAALPTPEVQDSALGAAARQDPSVFRQESTWNLAILQLQTVDGETREITAGTLAKVWITVFDEGAIRIEILYANKDYESLAVNSFAVIRTSADATSVDVPFVRDEKSGFAFPNLR